jgi:hypothetical protein
MVFKQENEIGCISAKWLPFLALSQRNFRIGTKLENPFLVTVNGWKINPWKNKLLTE